MTISIRGIVKKFDGSTALNGINLDIKEGELTALLGPSGSGKTTLLRVIAGLEFPTEGQVILDGNDASQRDVRDRRVGFVFQHYALFRHMTVFENVAFGLRVMERDRRPPEAEIASRVLALLELVQLKQFTHRYPSQLSGGQRQRVALARALAIEPRVLLLDEPFGALDAQVRKELRRWLRRLHDKMNLTSVFVTHDQEEAMEVSDKVVVMQKGQIEQIGTPVEVYDQPATPFVYEFLGNANRMDCDIVDGKARIWDEDFPVAAAKDGPAIAFVRPHEVGVTADKSQLGQPAIIRQIYAAGPTLRMELAVEGTTRAIEAELYRDRDDLDKLAVGNGVFIRARVAKIFPR